MPDVLKIGPFRFFCFARHVHVEQDGKTAKF